MTGSWPETKSAASIHFASLAIARKDSKRLASALRHHDQCVSLLGGDPAAPSGTATLLRLHPSHQPHLRRPPPQGLE
jgi:hypothetical protein